MSGLPDTNEPSDGLFQRITREPRLSEKVADSMLESIMSGQLEQGERLPSERDLGERFGVSRTVIREAVRALVAKGVVEVRPGSGVWVATIDAGTVRESMTIFLRSNPLNYEKVNEVRAVLEVEVAGLAAERATDDDVERLQASLHRMESVIADVEAASLEDVAFHRLIATSTHNPLYGVMLDSIGDVLLDIRRTTLAAGVSGTEVLRWHRRILERIEAHDVEGARAAMRGHLVHADQAWLVAITRGTAASGTGAPVEAAATHRAAPWSPDDPGLHER